VQSGGDLFAVTLVIEFVQAVKDFEARRFAEREAHVLLRRVKAVSEVGK
jgi:hypothetical protein